MTDYQKARELLEALPRVWEQERKYRAELTQLLTAMRRASDPALNRLLAQGRDIGLMLQELGDMMGCTREAVRQRLARPDSYIDRCALDPVPEHIVARLQALQAVATKLRGKFPKDSPARIARPKLVALMLALRTEGVPHAKLADMLGVGTDAVAARYRGQRRMGHPEALQVLESIPLDPAEEWDLPPRVKA